MIDRHWDGIAADCRPENKVSLGFVEGLNNKIRVDPAARLRSAQRRILPAQRFSPACCRNCSISDHLPVIARKRFLLRRSARRHSAQPERNLTDIAVTCGQTQVRCPHAPSLAAAVEDSDLKLGQTHPHDFTKRLKRKTVLIATGLITLQKLHGFVGQDTACHRDATSATKDQRPGSETAGQGSQSGRDQDRDRVGQDRDRTGHDRDRMGQDRDRTGQDRDRAGQDREGKSGVSTSSTTSTSTSSSVNLTTEQRTRIRQVICGKETPRACRTSTFRFPSERGFPARCVLSAFHRRLSRFILLGAATSTS